MEVYKLVFADKNYLNSFIAKGKIDNEI
jgi:hypothetical protein